MSTDINKHNPIVSVVIVSLDAKEMVCKCLDSILKQTYKDIEIILIDNGSIVNLKDALEEDYPSVKIIRLEENTGFAGGNNKGLEIAQGELIALINNDAEASPNWIEAMVKVANENPSYGAIGSIVIDGNDPQKIDSCGVGIALDGMSRQFMKGTPVIKIDKPMEVFAVSGCACLLRADALEDAGLFDEQFFAYCEDTDLSLRIRRAGWSIVIASDAVVTHFYSKTGGAFSLRKVFWVERNHFWVAIKNFPPILILLLPITSLWRFIIQFNALCNGSKALTPFTQGKTGIWGILFTIIRAQMSALLGMPGILAKRLRFHKRNKISYRQTLRLILQHKMSMQEIITGNAHQVTDQNKS